MLTFEGSPIQGSVEILKKLTVSGYIGQLAELTAVQSLPFEKVEHKVTTLDAQPSSQTVASLIVNVTGLLVVRDPCLICAT